MNSTHKYIYIYLSLLHHLMQRRHGPASHSFAGQDGVSVFAFFCYSPVYCWVRTWSIGNEDVIARAAELKEEFAIVAPLTLHWDGKLLLFVTTKALWTDCWSSWRWSFQFPSLMAKQSLWQTQSVTLYPSELSPIEFKRCALAQCRRIRDPWVECAFDYSKSLVVICCIRPVANMCWKFCRELFSLPSS